MNQPKFKMFEKVTSFNVSDGIIIGIEWVGNCFGYRIATDEKLGYVWENEKCIRKVDE